MPRWTTVVTTLKGVRRSKRRSFTADPPTGINLRKIRDGAADAVFLDEIVVMEGSVEESMGNESAEPSRQSTAVGVQKDNGGLGEERAVDADEREVAAEEGLGLIEGERAEVVADRDALGDRLEGLEAEHGA